MKQKSRNVLGGIAALALLAGSPVGIASGLNAYTSGERNFPPKESGNCETYNLGVPGKAYICDEGVYFARGFSPLQAVDSDLDGILEPFGDRPFFPGVAQRHYAEWFERHKRIPEMWDRG